MANIYLLINLSISNVWLAASVRANQQLLAKNNIDLVPFDSTNTDFVPYNMSFWYASANEPLSPALTEKLAAVQSSLDTGRSIIFLGQSADLHIQKTFFAFLRKHLRSENHSVIPLMIMGKPSLCMEFWWQARPQGVDENLAEKYINYARNTSKLVLQAQEEWGKEGLILIPYLHNSITPNTISEITHHIFTSIGIDDIPHMAAPLPFYGFTNTVSALRLLEARQVRHNDWPHLDSASYMAALQKLEQDWGPEPLSPLSYRQALFEKGREDQKKLEELLDLPAHSLDAPDWYGTLPELAASTPLKPERLQAFAESLTPPVRAVLLTRFANDHDFLSEDQKALALALTNTEGTEFGRMEEAQEQPLLTVLTMTLNHEKYIAQCIEGVLAQKTNFPVQHLILDHYSTDDTPQIINQYAKEYHSIRPVILNNYNRVYQNVHDLFMRCKSEYAALCDGDDYFIDPCKLQKQMDFLKSHPRCSLCFHPVAVVFENGQKSDVFPSRNILPRGIREEYYLSDMFKGNMIQTNSVVYKWRFRDGLPAWFRHDLCPGDWYWHLLHAEQGKIGFLPDIMSVYRRHGSSLFKHSFINSLEHRRKFGMAELETYHVVNEHFQGRYFLPLAQLANGILCEFLKIFMQEGDKRLLDLACESYPKFGRYFLSQVTLTSQPPVAQKGPK
ncbi:glycosyltransferase family 2 protein [Desulfovibrio sp. SGI.169]|uniref:glycosyltransferase family 2 protein n=1 Tax=Desulfovibrio sp. SGI.169 TaxID=3420561 RepID=UPI003D0038AE